MTESTEAIRRAAQDLLPQLSERLASHGLGEIEVRHGELRVRVASFAPPPVNARPPAEAAVTRSAAADPDHAAEPSSAADANAQGVPSPAVGFFVYADGLGPGLEVEKGDELGWVEMLGVRHDVRAPRHGTVRHLVAESGEAVEYGQVVIELGPAGGAG
jgi:acetyl-CoA carboxylase biotin carboxyl carrier protein